MQCLPVRFLGFELSFEEFQRPLVAPQRFLQEGHALAIDRIAWLVRSPIGHCHFARHAPTGNRGDGRRRPTDRDLRLHEPWQVGQSRRRELDAATERDRNVQWRLVPHHTDRNPVARLTGQHRPNRLIDRTNMLSIDRHDAVAESQARLGRRSVGGQSSHHDTITFALQHHPHDRPPLLEHHQRRRLLGPFDRTQQSLDVARRDGVGPAAGTLLVDQGNDAHQSSRTVHHPRAARCRRDPQVDLQQRRVVGST